ncbi:hypothetical protein AVEN_62242-1 [Araneus ventricosus]|uniref:Uncharacterized protein n=1 Tax=Araneus ventricosus TaxID=182803 RepID=A0A4Y2E8J1_ARAVE|nr:hypothetical protein AVEN_62242-1 [Araneus ventricosus]
MLTTEYEFRDILLESEETDDVIVTEIDESEAHIDQWRVLEIKLSYLQEQKRDCVSVVSRTLVVIVRGVGVKRRAIIDSEFQRSYILKTTTEEMGYQSKQKEHLQHSLFGGSKTSVCQHEERMLWETGNCKQLKSELTAIEAELGWTVVGRTTNSETSLNNRDDIIVPSPKSKPVLPNITTERFSLSFSPAADSKEDSSEFYGSPRSGGNSRINHAIFKIEKKIAQNRPRRTLKLKRNSMVTKVQKKPSEIRKNVDSDTDSSSGFKSEVEKPASKAATKTRARKASVESSNQNPRKKPLQGRSS